MDNLKLSFCLIILLLIVRPVYSQIWQFECIDSTIASRAQPFSGCAIYDNRQPVGQEPAGLLTLKNVKFTMEKIHRAVGWPHPTARVPGQAARHHILTMKDTPFASMPQAILHTYICTTRLLSEFIIS